MAIYGPQMAELFDRDKSVISRHLSNIFKDEELVRNSVVANFATTAKDGKTYQVEFLNLDAIISVGYRVNSKRGTAILLERIRYLTEVVSWYNCIPLKLSSGKKIDQKVISDLDFIEGLLQSPSENNSFPSLFFSKEFL